MRLELGTFHVNEVLLGGTTGLAGQTLTINRDELSGLIRQDPRITEVSVELVRPGEDARIIHIADVIEPRAGAQAGKASFPGFTGAVKTAGDGQTNRLAGVAVTTTCEFPWHKLGGIQIAREGILDMAGPGATFTPLSSLWHVVLGVELASDLSDEECDDAVRVAGLKAADYLGAATRGQTPDEMTAYELVDSDASLPRVVYLYQLSSQGAYASSFFYGGNLDRLLPTIVHPNEVLDGALVDGNLCGAAVRIPTYYHQNNPIVEQLYRDHGRELTFAGVVLVRGHYYAMEEKHRVVQQALKLIQFLKADGVLATWESAGNGLLESMYMVQACELAGIKTVLLTFEHGGRDGWDGPLQFYVPEAVAIVTTGSRDRNLDLPAVARVVGGDSIRLRPEVGGEYLPARGPQHMEGLLEMFAASAQAGWGSWARVDH
jgi:glycine reductase